MQKVHRNRGKSARTSRLDLESKHEFFSEQFFCCFCYVRSHEHTSKTLREGEGERNIDGNLLHTIALEPVKTVERLNFMEFIGLT